MVSQKSKSVSINIDPSVFNDVFYPYLDCYSRTQIIYGGSSSGKSHFVAERLVLDLMGEGRNYLVCRRVGKTIKTSVFAQVKRIISEWGVGKYFKISNTDFIITCLNGYQAVFIGLDDTEKMKSITPAKGAWTDIWVEEATELETIDSLKQLYKRQRGGDPNVRKRVILTFNPILRQHWIYNQYFKPVGWRDNQTEYKDDRIAILKTWYIHNRFLTPEDISDLENETDRYYYEVYTLGNWGILGHIVFKNWRVENLSHMRNQFLNIHNGLDFGFSNDPAGGVMTHYDDKHKTIYWFDEVYEIGMTNDILAGILKKKIGRELIVCDSAEPKSIAELRREGVNASPAFKGRDSVEFGIQWLQQQTIVVDEKCINGQNELAVCHYEENREGIVSRVPAKKGIHLIDGLRYAYEKESRGGKRKAKSHQG